MKRLAIITASALMAVAPQALAQDRPADEARMQDAGKAAETMIMRTYVHPATPIPPAQVIERLQEMGYTDIHDFDVEPGEYELEAKAPNGEDVEIEIDPITGAILEIEEDFF